MSLPLLQSYVNLEMAAYDVWFLKLPRIISNILKFALLGQHFRKNLELEEAVEAVIAGVSRAEEDFDVRTNIHCGLRQLRIECV